MIFFFKMFYSKHLLLCGENVKIVGRNYMNILCIKTLRKENDCKIPIFEVLTT